MHRLLLTMTLANYELEWNVRSSHFDFNGCLATLTACGREILPKKRGYEYCVPDCLPLLLKNNFLVWTFLVPHIGSVAWVRLDNGRCSYPCVKIFWECSMSPIHSDLLFRVEMNICFFFLCVWCQNDIRFMFWFAVEVSLWKAELNLVFFVFSKGILLNLC